MPHTCFVPNCKTGSQSMKRKNEQEGKKNPSIFRAPSDAKTLDLWVKSVPYKNRPFGPKDGICEFHFAEGCVERYFRQRVHETEEVCFLRGRLRLKRGSVPTIFPDSTPAENNSKRKKRKKSTKVEIMNTDVDETSANNKSVAESSCCDSSVAELSVKDENITDSRDHCASQSSHADDIIEQLTHDDSISESSNQGSEVADLPADPKDESVGENIKLYLHDDHELTRSYIVKLSPPESSFNDDSSERLSCENDEEPPICNSNDHQFAKIPSTWSLDDLYKYVSSLESLKDDKITCSRVQSAVILQQWHPTNYHCVKMIVIEENLRPQIYVENERVYCEELLTLNRISSETKLRSLIALVKELKAHPKMSDFLLESFYNKLVGQNIQSA